jgi:hypothetical protein
MSESVMVAVIASQGAVTALLAGWIFIHERSCAQRWAAHMQNYGELKGLVEGLRERGK